MTPAEFDITELSIGVQNIADDDVIAVGVRGTKHPLSSSLPAI
jgi:hypothetical protein